MESVKRNFIYNTLYNLLALIIPFITTPYISRVLGPNGVGEYSFTYSIAYYFVLFTMLGLTKYGNRTIASIRDDSNSVKKVFAEIYGMQLMTGLFSTILYIIFVQFIFKTNKFLFWIQLIYVISATFDISWFFFGIEQFRVTVTRNIVIRILNILLLFLFVKTEKDIGIYCGVMAGSALLSQISLWPFILKEYKGIEIPNLKNIIKHFKMNLLLFIPTIAVSFYKIMDKIMIGSIVGTIEVGYYENAEKIINIPMTLVTAIATVMLPRMTYYVAIGNKKEEERYIDLTFSFTIWISFALACGIMAIADIFVPWFLGDNFTKSISIVLILAPTMIFISVGTILCNQVLIPHKLDTHYIIIVLIGAAINFSLNCILISEMRSYGAAIATLVTEFIVMVGYSLAARNNIKMKEYLKKFAIYGVAGFSMFFILRLIEGIFKTIFFQLVIKVAIGGIYYIGVSMILAYFFDKGFYKYICSQLKNIKIIRRKENKIN